MVSYLIRRVRSDINSISAGHMTCDQSDSLKSVL